MPLTVAGMIPVIRAWIEMSEEEGMPILFETHRNCITNDLYATLCLLDAIPEMRLCADLSHYVVGREMTMPIPDREMQHMSRILARSDSFQGRVAGRQQVQLQLGFPQNQKWVELFKGWWREGFTSWQARNPDGTCVFLCELGPPDYAMTGSDGRELSNRWDEALRIKGWVEEIWSAARDWYSPVQVSASQPLFTLTVGDQRQSQCKMQGHVSLTVLTNEPLRGAAR